MSEHSRTVIEWQKRNPEKAKAHQAVNYAVRHGKLIKGVCEICGNEKVDGHHDDYSKPLEVRWLCRTHHKELHYGPKKERIKEKTKNKEKTIIEPEKNAEIEQLADKLYYGLDALEPEEEYPTILTALQSAYNLGRASVNTPARVAAARANGAKNTNFRGGRKPGSKDKSPRKPGQWAHKTQETEMKP